MSISPTQELKWKLAGIQAEKERYGNYLKILNEQEAIVTQQLVNGATVSTTTPGGNSQRRGRRPNSQATTSTTATPTRKRQTSPEARKRLSESMKQRWAQRRGETAQTTGAHEIDAPDLPDTAS